MRTRYASIIGEIIKCGVKLGMLSPNKSPINFEEKRKTPVVVSLTSYGRRVATMTPIVIKSLMRQLYKPDAIVLWLDNGWKDETLPSSIKRLQKKGLIVRYCDDLRSYKKLIPELQSPTISENEIIITVDDDQWYGKGMIKALVEAYHENPEYIHAIRGHKITFDSEGNINPYNRWNLEIGGETGRLILATGSAGCLYQRCLLHKDVCEKHLFQKLCPQADDVWFYFMEWLNNTKINILPKSKQYFYPLDMIYQHLHKGSSLMSQNCSEGGNDRQIKAVMEHYDIKSSDLND